MRRRMGGEGGGTAYPEQPTSAGVIFCSVHHAINVESFPCATTEISSPIETVVTRLATDGSFSTSRVMFVSRTSA
jgi:hypothetical protein